MAIALLKRGPHYWDCLILTYRGRFLCNYSGKKGPGINKKAFMFFELSELSVLSVRIIKHVAAEQ